MLSVVFLSLLRWHHSRNFLPLLILSALMGFAAVGHAQTPTNVALGKTIDASSTWSASYSPTQAVDGNSATGWSPTGTDTNAWIEVDLGQAYSLSQIQVITRQDYDQAGTRQNFTIWASNTANTNLGHVVLGSQGSAILPYQATWSIAVTDPTPYRYIQFVKTDGAYAFVSELRVLTLPVPTALTAAAGNASVSLSWTAPNGSGLTYNIKRATASGGPYTAVGSSGGTSYLDSGLTNGTPYYYVVTAVGSTGESGSSNQASATPSATALLAPMLSAQAQNAQVTLTWTSVTGAASYNLYRGTTPGGEGNTAYQKGITPFGPNPNYLDSSLANGTTYYYQVTAVNSSGEGPKSSEASATPGAAVLAAPLLKGVASSTKNTLTWSPIAGATSYNLYRTSGQGAPGFLYKTGLATSSFTDPGLTNGTAYGYYVCAVSASGQGSQSNIVLLTPGSPSLAAPSLSAQAASSTQINLTWSPVTGATSYNLYRSASAGGEGSAPYKTGITQQSYSVTFSDTGLTSGTSYYYTAVPVGPGGEGASSNEASATPGSTALAAPALKGVAGSGQVTLTWSSVTGAASYNLYRTSGQGGPGLLYKTGLTASPFTDVGLTNGSPYTYSVTAVALSGEGTASNQITLVPGSPALAAPLLSAQAASSTQITLSWSPITGASTYNLYRSLTPGGQGIMPYKADITMQGPTLTYPDTGLTSGTMYYYKVVAVGPGGEGAFSNEASAVPGTAALAAPILKGVAGATANTLTWSAIAGAASYNLYRSAGGSYYGILYQQGLTTTTFSDTSVTTSTSYSYYVCAASASGQGNQSNTVLLTPGSPTLAAPLLSAQATSGTQINLTWSPVTGATSYNLYRSLTSGGEGTIPYKVGLTGTSASDTGLTSGTMYYYTVAAVGPGGEGMFSNEATATAGALAVAAPVLKGTTSGTQNALTWGNVSNAASYNLYRNGSLYRQGLAGTTFNDSALTTSTTYTYSVTAVNAGGEGAQSNPVSLTVGASPLPATLLAATVMSAPAGGTSSYVSVQWDPVVGATSYNLYRGTSAGGEGAVPITTGIIGSAGTMSIANDGLNSNTGISSLTNGVTYYYQIVPVGAAGEGAFSSEVSATPGVKPLPAVAGLQSIPGYGTLTLTWQSVTNAASYNVYRNNLLIAAGVTTLTYTDSGTGPGSFNYAVAAVNKDGQGTLAPITASPNDFSLSPSPLLITAGAGTTGTTAVGISRSGTLVGAALALNMTGAVPPGVTYTFFPSPVVGSTALYVCIGAGVPAGTYSFTLVGAAPGSPSPLTHSIPVTLTVTSP